MTAASPTDGGVRGPQRPVHGCLVDEQLFYDDPDGRLRLAGSRCCTCATVTFPAALACPRCAGESVERIGLPRYGRVWGFTVQAFPPKPPYLGAQAPFQPYVVAYVQLGDLVRVESRLVIDPADLAVGSCAHLVLEVIPGSDLAADGGPVWTFAFAPCPERDARLKEGADADV